MIVGIINPYREAVVRVPLLCTGGQHDVEAVLDTGFSGSLTLPPSLILSLGLPFRSRGGALLADGSLTQFDIYTATLVWDGTPRYILVEAADTDPLLGMGLLYGCNINIRAVDGGTVTIEQINTASM